MTNQTKMASIPPFWVTVHYVPRYRLQVVQYGCQGAEEEEGCAARA